MSLRSKASVWCGVWLLLCAQLSGAPAWSQEPAPSREYQIKAVFLYNFTRFINWPESAFSSPEAPFVICVLGADPFGKALDEVIAGETVEGRPLQVRRYQRAEQLQSCQILYVGRSELPHLDDIRQALGDEPVLTVSDAQEFTSRGGMIQLDTVDGKIGLTVNLDASRRAGLTLSSKLLRAAQIVASTD